MFTITNNEGLIKKAPRYPVKVYVPEEDAILSESIYIQDVKTICLQAIEHTIATKTRDVVFSIPNPIDGYFSFIINTLFNVLSEKSVYIENNNLNLIILIQKKKKYDDILDVLDTALTNPSINAIRRSFGDYGDRLKPEFENYVVELETQMCFIEYLCDLIDAKGFAKYADAYHASGISKSTFSKIMNVKNPHQPSKGTVAALSIGLRLNLDEAQKLYNVAGYYLGYFDLIDKIIRFFIEKQIYDINEVNYCLLHYDLPPLGERAREPKVRFRR